MTAMQYIYEQLLQFHPFSVLPASLISFLWVIVLIIAAANCFFGYHIRIISCAFAGFLIGYSLLLLLAQFYQGLPFNTTWMSVASGTLIALLAVFFHRFGEFLLSFAALSLTIWNMITSQTLILLLLILAFSFVISLFIFRRERSMLILITSVCGAWWSLFSVLSVFSVSTVNIRPVIYLFTAIFAAAGIFVQLRSSSAAAEKSSSGPRHEKEDHRNRRAEYSGPHRRTDPYRSAERRPAGSPPPVDYLGPDPRYDHCDQNRFHENPRKDHDIYDDHNGYDEPERNNSGSRYSGDTPPDLSGNDHPENTGYLPKDKQERKNYSSADSFSEINRRIASEVADIYNRDATEEEDFSDTER